MRRRQIEEQVATARAEQARQEQEKVNGSGRLSREQIVERLNEVPVFVVLNGDKNAVSMQDTVNGGETVYWHTDPAEAKAQLELVRELNPGVDGLHLGGGRLGMAYQLGAGWAPSTPSYAGDARTGAADESAPTLRHEIVMEANAKEAMPVFLCEALQTPMLVPVFVDRTDLARAWLASGRTRESFKEEENLTTMDLRMLVHQMTETDHPAWSIVRFVPSGRAAAVVRSANEKLAKAIEDGDEPPLLTDGP